MNIVKRKINYLLKLIKTRKSSQWVNG